MGDFENHEEWALFEPEDEYFIRSVRKHLHEHTEKKTASEEEEIQIE